jgi:hypothetical protein
MNKILYNNTLIAKFDGYIETTLEYKLKWLNTSDETKIEKLDKEYIPYLVHPNKTEPLFIDSSHLSYDKDWRLLMPVYIKINKLIQEKSGYDFIFGTESNDLHSKMWEILEDENCNIYDLWIAIVEFLKFYNKYEYEKLKTNSY